MESYEELYDTICRVCLSYGNYKTMVNLTEISSSDGLSCYGKAVSIFANVDLTNNKRLPNKMCESCLFRLKQAILFKKTCENSDEKFKKLTKKFNNSQLDFKQKVCEFLMYINCFPHQITKTCLEETFRRNKIKKVEEIDEFGVKNELKIPLDSENDFDDSFPSECQEDTEPVMKFDTQDCDYDQMLDEMEKIIEMTPEKLNSFRKKYTKTTNVKVMKKLKSKFNIKRLVKKNEDLQCKICLKVLTHINSYNSHMARHTGGQFICEHCGKKYATKGELQYHLASSHNIGEMYICKVCGFKAPKKYELMEHERLHTGERPYTCDKCGLTFRRKYIWKKHALCHMEKNIQCPQCPRKFSQRRDVLSHINNVHDRMYVFACSQCDVTYAKSTSVRRHLVEKHGIARELQGKIKRINLGKCSLSNIGV